MRAKDTPNFIANRVGIAGMLATLKEVEKFGLTPDVVDDLTGKKLGRASSGTFRTADVVGLDTHGPCREDAAGQPGREERSVLPQLRDAAGAGRSCSRQGYLGQKTKAGFYKKVGRDILRFDLAEGEYVPGGAKADEVYGRMLKKPAAAAPEAAARERRARRASSSGPSCATASTTRRCTWRPSPRARATSTSRCAGASA